jgi:flagellar basal-body rod protein FlgC
MTNSSNSSLAVAAGAMTAQSWGLAVTAHNVANVSTAGFQPGRAAYATGPAGFGARLSAVVPAADAARPEAANGASAVSPAQAVYDVTTIVGAPSGTDLGTASVEMIATQHAYEANAQVVRTADAMLGTLLDMKA